MKLGVTLRHTSGREERCEVESLPRTEENLEIGVRQIAQAETIMLQADAGNITIPRSPLPHRQMRGVRQARELE